MLTRRFGRTEIAMPILTCGGMRFQQSWNPEDVPSADSQSNLEAIVRRALEVGVNHFETARGYGTSEKQLGLVLSKIPRHEYLLQTKVAPTEDPDEFEKHFFESLSRLHVAHVDLLGIHGLNDQTCVDWACRDGGCLERALLLKQRGLVRYVGFSTHAPEPLILKAIVEWRRDSAEMPSSNGGLRSQSARRQWP